MSHDGKGMILNINADTMASELAIELSNYYNIFLFYCFEKKGVLLDSEDENSVISQLDHEMFMHLKEENIISSGMIPKLDTGFKAKRNGVREILITNAENIATGKGTRIV